MSTPSGNGKHKLPETHTSAELLTMVFPEPVWLVPGTIPEGLTLLVGAPKVGKSWLALALAGALSIGGRAFGSIVVPHLPTLLLALEDRPRRLQNRMQMLGILPSPDLHYVTEWRRGNDAVADLGEWLDLHPTVKVVIVDVLEKIRASRGNQGLYEADYAAIALLKSLADRRGVSIIVLLHDRKMEAVDWLDTVSGSKGLTACADTIIMLRKNVRRESSAELSIVGRDVEDTDLALTFTEDAGWSLLGEAFEYRCTKERREILDALRSIGKPAGAKALADLIGKSRQNVQKQLAGMLNDGVVQTDGSGHYGPRATGSNWGETGCSGVSPVAQTTSRDSGNRESRLLPAGKTAKRPPRTVTSHTPVAPVAQLLTSNPSNHRNRSNQRNQSNQREREEREEKEQ